MTIQDWDGTALIIGAGGIGKSISDHLKNISPNLDIKLCSRNTNSNDDFYLEVSM